LFPTGATGSAQLFARNFDAKPQIHGRLRLELVRWYTVIANLQQTYNPRKDISDEAQQNAPGVDDGDAGNDDGGLVLRRLPAGESTACGAP
jgi:hypothetical protein